MTSESAEQNAAAAPSSERQRSGWDIRNAPKNYFWLIVFQAGSAVFTFAAVWLINRHLGIEGWGGIFAVIAASQVAQVFVNWTGIAVIRYGVDEFVETAIIARTFWTRFAVLTINLILVLVLASVWFPPLADWLKLPPTAFWLVLAHFAVTALWMHVQVGLQAAKMLRAQGFLQMLERLVIFIGIAGLVGGHSLAFSNAVICYITAPAVMAIAGLFRLRGVIFSASPLDRGSAKKILVYSLPLLPFTLVGFLSGSYVDAAFVSKMLSTRDLGAYSLATQINGIAMQLPTLANTLLLPLFVTLQTETGGERSFAYFRNILPAIVLGWGLGCALLAFGAYWLLPAVFGADAASASVPTWLLLAASVVWIPVAIGYSALANSMSSTYIPMIAGIFSAAVNIAANFALIPRYGMIGCAIATLLAYAAAVFVFAALLKKTAAMPVSWTFLAIVPSLAGVAMILVYESPALALAACIAVSCIVGLMKRDSIIALSLFISGLRRPA